MALVTAAAIISDARTLLSDTIAPYRWSDVALLGYLYQGELLTVGNHAEAQYDTAVVSTMPVMLTIGQTTSVVERWQTPLAAYCAFRALTETTDDVANDKKAAELRSLWEADMLLK